MFAVFGSDSSDDSDEENETTLTPAKPEKRIQDLLDARPKDCGILRLFPSFHAFYFRETRRQ